MIQSKRKICSTTMVLMWMKWKKYWSTVQVFILYKSWVIKYYVPILGLVLVLYTMPSWVHSYNNNIAAWNARARSGRFFTFSSFHFIPIRYTPRQITFFARQSRLPPSERSPAFRSRESWTHRVHINQTDFNPHIYSSQQTVVQRVYATSCAFLR